MYRCAHKKLIVLQHCLGFELLAQQKNADWVTAVFRGVLKGRWWIIHKTNTKVNHNSNRIQLFTCQWIKERFLKHVGLIIWFFFISQVVQTFGILHCQHCNRGTLGNDMETKCEVVLDGRRQRDKPWSWIYMFRGWPTHFAPKTGCSRPVGSPPPPDVLHHCC